MPGTFRTPWYDKSIESLQLAGMSGRTQECYARGFRMMIEHFNKDPLDITEEELRKYFLFRQNETKWSPGTLKIHYCAIKFFFVNVLRREWHIFNSSRRKAKSASPAS